MKIRFIPLIIAVIFGCSESDKVEPSTGTCYLTKFVKSPAFYDVFEWDVEGRVSKRRYYDNNKLYHTVNIIYGGSSTTLTYNYENGTEPNTVRYDYNSKGQLIKEVSSWGAFRDTVFFTYSDDSRYFKGINYKGTNASEPQTFEWSNGNIIKASSYDGYIEFEYDNKINPFQNMMCYDLGFETGVLPTFVKNNVIKSTKYPNDGSAAIVETLTCKYNEKDYPIGYTANGTENMSLEYQCNN